MVALFCSHALAAHSPARHGARAASRCQAEQAPKTSTQARPQARQAPAAGSSGSSLPVARSAACREMYGATPSPTTHHQPARRLTQLTQRAKTAKGRGAFSGRGSNPRTRPKPEMHRQPRAPVFRRTPLQEGAERHRGPAAIAHCAKAAACSRVRTMTPPLRLRGGSNMKSAMPLKLGTQDRSSGHGPR